MASKQHKRNHICKNTDLFNTMVAKDVAVLEGDRTQYLIEKSIPKTSDIYKTINLPKKFDCPYVSVSYGITRPDKQHALYRTVNSQYGYFPPNIHTVPTRYYPRGQKFSNLMAKFGMYNDYTLNNSLTN